MSIWVDEILEFFDYVSVEIGTNTLTFRFPINKEQYYTEHFKKVSVFRFVFFEKYAFKNCFITSIKRCELDDTFIVIFHVSEQIKGEGLIKLLRGIKLHRLKKRLESIS